MTTSSAGAVSRPAPLRADVQTPPANGTAHPSQNTFREAYEARVTEHDDQPAQGQSSGKKEKPVDKDEKDASKPSVMAEVRPAPLDPVKPIFLFGIPISSLLEPQTGTSTSEPNLKSAPESAPEPALERAPSQPTVPVSKSTTTADSLAFLLRVVEPAGGSAPQTESAKVTTAAAPKLQMSAADPKQSGGNETNRDGGSSQDSARPQGEPAQRFVATTAAHYEAATLPAPPVSSTADSKQSAAPASSSVPSRVEQAAAASGSEPKTGAVTEITLHVNGPDQSNASLRISDRSGEIHMTVHASDPVLAASLRGGADDLKSHLEGRGFSADVWKPEAVAAAAATRESGNQNSSTDQEATGRGDQRQFSNQSKQHQESTDKRPKWLDEFSDQD